METEKESLWMASWQSLVNLARAASWSSGANLILNWGDAGAAGEYDKFSSWTRIRGRSQEMSFLPSKLILKNIKQLLEC